MGDWMDRRSIREYYSLLYLGWPLVGSASYWGVLRLRLFLSGSDTGSAQETFHCNYTILGAIEALAPFTCVPLILVT